jgi:hypothetical protein
MHISAWPGVFRGRCGPRCSRLLVSFRTSYTAFFSFLQLLSAASALLSLVAKGSFPQGCGAIRRAEDGCLVPTLGDLLVSRCWPRRGPQGDPVVFSSPLSPSSPPPLQPPSLPRRLLPSV